MQNSPDLKNRVSIVLAFGFCPPGIPAINTPGTLALRALPLGCSDENSAGFIADHAPESLTGSTECRFVAFFTVTHTSTTKIYRDTKNDYP